jgi:hypothetical protein
MKKIHTSDAFIEHIQDSLHGVGIFECQWCV